MSFPVLQRTDRKRPELIQPISWQAEALKGLASGIKSGIEIASNMQRMQLLKQQNARDELAAQTTNALRKEQLKALQIENGRKELNNKYERLLLEGETIQNTSKAEIENLRLLHSYTGGIAYMATASALQHGIDTKSKTPANIDEGLRTGYFLEKKKDIDEKVNVIKGFAPTADKLKTINEIEEIVSPFRYGFAKLDSVLEKNSPVNTIKNVFQTKYTDLYDTIPMRIVVTESNKNMIDDDIRAMIMEKHGKELKDVDVDAELNKTILSGRPIEIPYRKAISGLRGGFYVEDFAKAYDEASDKEWFIKHLRDEKISEATINAIQRKVADTSTINASPSEFPLGNRNVPKEPAIPSSKETKVVDGLEVSMDKRNVFEKFGDAFARNVSQPLANVEVRNQAFENIIADAPYASTSFVGGDVFSRARSILDNSSHEKVKSNYEYLNKEYQSISELQKKYADNPDMWEQATLQAGILDKLDVLMSKMEKEYNLKRSDTNTMPQTPVASELKNTINTNQYPKQQVKLMDLNAINTNQYPKQDVYAQYREEEKPYEQAVALNPIAEDEANNIFEKAFQVNATYLKKHAINTNQYPKKLVMSDGRFVTVNNVDEENKARSVAKAAGISFQ